MARGVFIAGTGTDVGKTYLAARLLQTLLQAGVKACYYKAAMSGAAGAPTDLQAVAAHTGLDTGRNCAVSYAFDEPLSPHLAARRAGVTISLAQIKRDYQKLACRYDFVLCEGSGGIVCPLALDGETFLQEDVIRALGLPVLVVAHAGLGTINHTVLTAAYLQQRGIPATGLILNRYEPQNAMHRDNADAITCLTALPILARVPPGGGNLGLQVA